MGRSPSDGLVFVEAKELEAAEDSRLVQACLDGDPQAFEALLRRHENRVYGVCLRMLGSPSLAEEAAQDVLVKVYRNLHRFRGESKFTTWLYKVALNHCRNVQAYRARRHEKRHDSLDAGREDDEGNVQRRELPAGGPDTEDALLTSERLRLLQEELAKLDPLWREILVLRDVEGRSYDEIMTALELTSVGTVKSRLHRARAQLKARLDRRLRGDRD